LANTAKKILVVGVDDSSLGKVVLRAAFDIATETENCELHAIHVGVTDTYEEREVPRELQYLHGLVTERIDTMHAEGAPIPRVFVHAAIGEPAREITRLAEKLRGGLVVVGTHAGGAIDRLVLGSVASRVLRRAPCSVLVVRDKIEAHHHRGIDPDCRDCATARAKSDRKILFCERHRDDDVYMEVEPSASHPAEAHA
jgi:nucleotide-binding universal stress UspA family protein